MHNTRDTFLHFLSDNLGGIAVHYVTRDPDNPSADLLSLNAVNVEFLNLDLAEDVSAQQVSVDIIADSSDTAVEWVQSVWDLLRSAFYTPLNDYTDPANPVTVGGNLMWDSKVQFRLVHSENYTHYSTLLNLRFH